MGWSFCRLNQSVIPTLMQKESWENLLLRNEPEEVRSKECLELQARGMTPEAVRGAEGESVIRS